MDSTNENVFTFGRLEEENTWWEMTAAQTDHFRMAQMVRAHDDNETTSLTSDAAGIVVSILLSSGTAVSWAGLVGWLLGGIAGQFLPNCSVSSRCCDQLLTGLSTFRFRLKL